MALTEKDKKLLINKPNRHFSRTEDGMGVRMMVCNATQAILDVYENKRDNIQGELVIVRDRKDENLAASARNSARNALLVFTYQPDSYFTSTCYEVTLSDALRKRALAD